MSYQQLSKNKVSLYSKLAKKKYRCQYGLFVAEGEKCVADTLGAFEVEAIIVSSDYVKGGQLDLHELTDKVYVGKREDIIKISQLSTPPDVLAVYKLPSQTAEVPQPDKGELSLALDGVQDPGNLGTIIRTAAWFGIKRIYASKECVDVFNAKTIQSTMGAISNVAVYYCDLSQILSKVDLPVFGTILEGGENIYKNNFVADEGVIVMGSEGHGLSERIKEMVTVPLFIPPYPENGTGHPESLNVAVATAVVLSEFRRRLLM